MISARYISPRVRSLLASQLILKSGQETPLNNDAVYMYIIVTCHQLLSFLGVSYWNGRLTGTEMPANESHLQINIRDCGGKPVNVNELTNIRKSLLAQMILTARHIHHLSYTGNPEQLNDIYLNKGGIDYLFLLLKQHFYDETGTAFPTAFPFSSPPYAGRSGAPA